MDLTTVLVIVAAIAAIAFGFFLSRSIMSASAGNDRMQEIAKAIQEGADAYLSRQYKTIGIVGILIAVALLIAFQGNFIIVVGFLLGAILSGAAGFIGMKVSVQANVRTTEASMNGG
ncbi:MAG TPA: sodium-translocating pyrophosphatase, partial [Hyphomonadaceae bacterium]|nr:sodium-translocating pyrophosphatase [Hyphomonadaceae bacterium]